MMGLIGREFNTAEDPVRSVPWAYKLVGDPDDAKKGAMDEIMMGEHEFCWILAKDGHQLRLPKHEPSSKRKMCWSVPAEWNEIELGDALTAIKCGIMVPRIISRWDYEAYLLLRSDLGKQMLVKYGFVTADIDIYANRLP
jgi:hypothetical protein